jgi:hypothetical protein
VGQRFIPCRQAVVWEAEVGLMTIRRRTYLFAAFTGLCVALSASVLACGLLAPEIQTRLLLALSVLVSGGMAGLWAREHGRLRAASLIFENCILRIPVAVIDEAGDAAKPENAKSLEVFVSYFGILLGSRIVKFNQDGIILKGVEIGRDFLNLTYGTERGMRTTRLLRAEISQGELERIVERFRYETGVVPVTIN